MAAKIAMSDTRTKVGFLAVSTIRQKDLSSAVGGALLHAIVMWSQPYPDILPLREHSIAVYMGYIWDRVYHIPFPC